MLSTAEQAETIEEQTQTIITAEYQGIKTVMDMYLCESHYGGGNYGRGDYEPVFLSMWGSEIQCRGIFAALVQSCTVTVGHKTISRSWSNKLRYRSKKIGYGKYHAITWEETLSEKAVVFFRPEEENSAWEKFFKKRLIPVANEWIPDLVQILIEKEMVTVLTGLNAYGYILDTNDDSVCDLIVENIHK